MAKIYAEDPMAKVVTCKARVTGTDTETVWKNRAKEGGYYVKTDTTQTDSRGGGLLPVEFVEDDDIPIYGQLKTVTGSGSDLNVGIQIESAESNALTGEATAAELTDAEIGQTLRGAPNGRLKIAAGGENCRVIGGNNQNLRITFDFKTHVR